MIYHSVNWLDASKEITSIQLPNVTKGANTGVGGKEQDARLHIFAVSLVPAKPSGVSLEIERARSTQTWIEGTNKTQIVQVKVNNVGTEWLLAKHGVKITVDSPGLTTVVPGVVNRLRPGDQATVNVGVVNTKGTAEGSSGEATALVTGDGVNASATFNATFGIGDFEPTYDSIYSHEPAPWYTNGKYGIFIHWGVYAVPGWGDVGEHEQYAEWYWRFYSTGPFEDNRFYKYNLETYGANHEYDDFIQNFTADAWDPKEWVDLFADAGAQYFTQVSKHHDGYALFDIPANITTRTSVAQFPHRNLLQELFDAADQYQPHLHKTTYFSPPEWFHPDYKSLGFSAWPGGNATNPYTNKTVPYLGYVPVNDYVQDLILPEMRILAEMGTEILWCDIGIGSGPDADQLAGATFAAKYFNDNAAKGKQVLINNRCGGIPGDFDTPEYARYESVQVRKWESNLGMDPFSYGYNRATPDDQYLKPRDIVVSLIDIVSKNGNFLLDVGPTANGTIVQIEQDNLRAAGKWIKSHGEAIFNTNYWFVTAEEGDTIRFTQNANAFYISALYAPNDTLVIDSPVPYVDGDEVTVVGGQMAGTVVPSELLSNGSLQLTVTEEIKNADMYAWVFKISFGGVEDGTIGGTASMSGSGGNSSMSGSGSNATSSGVEASTGGAGKRAPEWVNLGALLLLAVTFYML
ncbi:glycoside hydrolase family 29 protein [Pseudocercospora fijiensis CIRAD86]|uniref:alpha-L-fucosidase n=1 Tax=Pseudocercospora fijiensis (strain CIRAD86) TaxID=383855 RepID=M3A0Z7_PSEFD|nr:glycoside hydrolase family 29 protein [Pseudocercospora fijiensis CIRAD86]EME84819.1 glycoside hydrolase family 29 protein [Pseudocercospora fijiensis CIRAD86]